MWRAVACASMGLGVCAIHVIAILALKISPPAGYHIGITPASAVVAIIGSWGALGLALGGARSLGTAARAVLVAVVAMAALAALLNGLAAVAMGEGGTMSAASALGAGARTGWSAGSDPVSLAFRGGLVALWIIGLAAVAALFRAGRSAGRHVEAAPNDGLPGSVAPGRRAGGFARWKTRPTAAFGAQDLPSSTARRIREPPQAETQLARTTRYDPLTHLPNRDHFVETLSRCIAEAGGGKRELAILYMDLDGFKDVNDTLGRPVGDRLLIAVAQSLRRNVGTSDMVARFGGDEFAILLDADETSPRAAPNEQGTSGGGRSVATSTTSAAICAAETVLSTFGEPFVIDANVIRISATLGIAVWGDDAPPAETLLSRADVALYHAKSHLRGTWCVFTAAMETHVRARVTIARELSEAIAGDQFLLMYQPQVDLESGRIVGLEALARWRHPTRGLLSAGDFIPAAELNGLIAPLGRWVIREACRQIRLWLDTGVTPPMVAVNLSAMQFRLRSAFPEDIAAALAEFDLPPCVLELELTESVLMETSRPHDDVVSRLRAKGHRIAIDDFGSGYSSLDYLRRYPVDRLKIDPVFVADLGRTPGADAIVRVAFELGRALAIEVVAEGVETEAQLLRLRSFGARIAQGYYFAKPLAPDEVIGLLTTGTIAGGETNAAGHRLAAR